MKVFAVILVSLLMLNVAFAAESKTLKKIKDSGVITMGVRESSGALSYTLGNNKYVGYHVEICEKVLATIQKNLGLKKLEIKYVPVTSQNRMPLIQNGTIDIECGSTTNNIARAKDVSFAVTTFVEEIRIAVKASSGITDIAGLNKKTIATTTGTTTVQTLRKNKKATGLEFKELYGKDHSDAFLLLESGRADAFIMDGTILAGNIARAKNPADFKIVGDVLSVEPIAIMLPKDDAEFKKAVDEPIKAMMKSGEIAKLWDKWFLKPIPPTNTKVNMPANENTKAAWATPNEKPMEEYTVKN
ncbi:MAG: amino acid ABC transporter substrate-binding protein [Bdellovibrio sp.]|nr:amino acid ABC transporter substrate-binding protein [Bdellovibrio sp.]